MNIRIDGIITLLSPLSHIGESHGPDSYLSESTIIGPDGRPIQCFTYSGNAFRGMIRDLGSQYLLEKLGNIQLPIELFYMLFSGGSIGGDQSIDIDQGRRYRKALPLFSILGGGVGNQILQGKMNIGAMFPLVRECQRVLPKKYRSEDAPSWRHWTTEHSFTRTDDAKNDNLRQFIALPEEEKPLIEGGQTELFEEKKEAPKKKKEALQQMRYNIELLATGSQLYQRIDLIDVNELELGAFVSALHQLSKKPYIGGQNRIGMGLIEADYEYRDESGKIKPFMTIAEEQPEMGSLAEGAKQKYDAFLKEMYDQYIIANKAELAQMLSGKVG